MTKEKQYRMHVLKSVCFILALAFLGACDMDLHGDDQVPQAPTNNPSTEPDLLLTYSRGCPVYVNPKAYTIKIYEDARVERAFYPCSLSTLTPDWTQPQRLADIFLSNVMIQELIANIAVVDTLPLQTGASGNIPGQTTEELYVFVDHGGESRESKLMYDIYPAGTGFIFHYMIGVPPTSIVGLVYDIRDADL